MRRSAASAVADLDFRGLTWENDPHGGGRAPGDADVGAECISKEWVLVVKAVED